MTRGRAVRLAALLGALVAAPLAATTAQDAPAREATRADPAARLWDGTAPLAVTLTANLARLRRDTDEDAPWRDAVLTLDDTAGGRTTLPARVRTRGLWRLRNCAFPPLRVDVPRARARATVLAGVDRPKLVAHCRDDDRGDEYVLRELQLYRIHALLTPFAHRARLLRVTYVDSASGRALTTRWAILLEEPEALARRVGGRLIETEGARGGDLDPASSTITSLFQYLIGNTDWSVAALHNVELVATDALLHPVPYDFDHAGAVDAYYARPPPQLQLRSVRERLFRGFCVPADEFERAFALFRARRAAIEALYADDVGRLLPPRTVERTLEYVAEFYRTIDDPRRARREIVGACRGEGAG